MRVCLEVHFVKVCSPTVEGEGFALASEVEYGHLGTGHFWKGRKNVFKGNRDCLSSPGSPRNLADAILPQLPSLSTLLRFQETFWGVQSEKVSCFVLFALFCF